MTPLHRASENGEINEIGLKREAPLSGYVDIIKEVSGHYGLPVCDLFNESGMQPEVGIIREKYVYLQLSSIWTIFIKKIIQCVLLMCGFAAAAVVFVDSVVKSATFPSYPQIIYIHMTHM